MSLPDAVKTAHAPMLAIAGGIAAAVEESLNAEFPDLTPRTRGYDRAGGVHLTLTTERNGALRIDRIAPLTASDCSRMRRRDLVAVLVERCRDAIREG